MSSIGISAISTLHTIDMAEFLFLIFYHSFSYSKSLASYLAIEFLFLNKIWKTYYIEIMKSDYYCNFEKVKKIRELDQVEVEMFLLEDEPSKNKRRR